LEDVEFNFKVFSEFELSGVFSVHDIFPEILILFVCDFLENGLECGGENRQTSDISIDFLSQEGGTGLSSLRGLDGTSEEKVPLSVVDDLIIDLDFGGDHETIEEFVFFKETSTNVDVETLCDVIDQQFNSFL
jgi:hypothetical protein